MLFGAANIDLGALGIPDVTGYREHLYQVTAGKIVFPSVNGPIPAAWPTTTAGVTGFYTIYPNPDQLLAGQLDGCRVETVESLAAEGPLSPLQERFHDEHALQCGFCTPAFLMTATALAADGRALTRAELRDELAGVLCRCTGYEFILNAVEAHLAAAATGESRD